MPDPLTFVGEKTASCPAHNFEPAAGGTTVTPSVTGPSYGAVTTKSATILGGQVSTLDRIRQQQGQLAAKADAAARDTPAALASSCFGAAPAMSLAATTPSTLPAAQVARGSDNFLGSSRIGIGQTPFDHDWQRVSAQELAPANVYGLVGSGLPANAQTLSQVNRWANRQIEYAEDLSNYGSRDYWATAGETLRSGRGDCEDFAILKYQMLAALGFDRSQMYLTLARDLVRNADHAVLVVRVEGRHYMLDNAVDVLLPASISHDYRPTISFSSESAWLHGLASPALAASTSRPEQLSYLSDNAVSSARVTGFNK